jgi:hypothetical protein
VEQPIDSNEMRDLAAELRERLAPEGWSVRLDETVDSCHFVFEHPLSNGTGFTFFGGVASYPREQLLRFLEDWEFVVIRSSPSPIRHPEVLRGFRAAAENLSWPRETFREVAYLLGEVHVLDHVEAEWLAESLPPTATGLNST